jgi:hypothetical protein
MPIEYVPLSGLSLLDYFDPVKEPDNEENTEDYHVQGF